MELWQLKLPSGHINTRPPIDELFLKQNQISTISRHLSLLLECKKTKPETYDPLMHKFCSNTVNRLKLKKPRTHCEKQQEIGNNHSMKLNSWFLSMLIIFLLFIHILTCTLLFRVYMLAIQKMWFCSHRFWHRVNKNT